MKRFAVLFAIFFMLSMAAISLAAETAQIKKPAVDLSPADPVANADSALMLDLPGIGTDASKIDFYKLPRLKTEHGIVTLGTLQWKFRLHNYIAWYDGRYWAIWSHGPIVEDAERQHIHYATSCDGVHWSKSKVLVGPPKKGFGYIARGLWLRDGEMIAMATLFNAPDYIGPGLALEGFRWDKEKNSWEPLGRIMDDTMNHFPPKKLPDGNWMMSRRDHKRAVSIIVGGKDDITDWEIVPYSNYSAAPGIRPEEPYWYFLPDGKNIVGLFRNNAGKSILRSFSTDFGRSWTPAVVTNFPDASSKFFVVNTSNGDYAMVSNPNPKARNPLCLSLSKDRLVYKRMAVIEIPAKLKKTDWQYRKGYHTDYEALQYPHAMEHDGSLIILFSRRKQTIESVKIPMEDVNKLWN